MKNNSSNTDFEELSPNEIHEEQQPIDEIMTLQIKLNIEEQKLMRILHGQSDKKVYGARLDD